ncbi:MAG: hypothetical protein ACJAUL_003340 [Paraglaciecola sp.]|jgi:hypothetical protein
MSCGELYIYFVVKVVCKLVHTVTSVTATGSLQQFSIFYFLLHPISKESLAFASFKTHISALHQAIAMILNRVLISILGMNFKRPKRHILTNNT